MRIYNNPNKEHWTELIKRPTQNEDQLIQTVSSIINDVKLNGDQALVKYARMFDGVDLNRLEVSTQEIETAINQTPKKLKDAIDVAYNNITLFHKAQHFTENDRL